MAAWISVLLHLRLLGALPGPTEREVKLKRGGDTGTNYPLLLVAIRVSGPRVDGFRHKNKVTQVPALARRCWCVSGGN